MSYEGAWIGVDLDGTLAEYHGWKGVDHIGAPIPKMVERVKKWLAEGKEVRIVTARVAPPTNRDPSVEEVAELMRQMAAIISWTKDHIGQELEVTCMKDFGMVELWDDRCKQVVPNTGELVQPVCGACGEPQNPKRLLTSETTDTKDVFGTFWFCDNLQCRRGPILLRSLKVDE